MLFGDGLDYNVVMPIIAEHCGQLAADLKVAIDVDALVVKECYKLAEQSCGFHGTGEASHIKQAAHMGFWINKLRPISTRQKILEVVRKQSGIDNLIEWFDGEYGVRMKQASSFHVNEFISFMVIRELISFGYDDIDRILSDVADTRDLRHQLNDINTRMDNAAHLLVPSFRYHVHSTKAIATLFEIAYYTGYEHEHEQ